MAELRAAGEVRLFLADDSSVTPGTPVTLSWEVDPGQSALRITPGLGDVTGSTVDGRGSLVVSPGPSESTIYTLDSDSPTGGGSATVAVTVGPAPTISGFTPTIDATDPEGRWVLDWEVAGASELQISPQIGRVPASGSGYYEIVAPGSLWEYLDDGSDQGVAWREPNFDSSAWAAGPGELGYGERDEATVVGYGGASGAKAITTYFRHTFFRTAVDTVSTLRLGIRYDDGAIVYLNGVEVGRYNLPAGSVGHLTPALGDVAGDANDYEFHDIPAQLLREGRNVFAVEIHQSRPASSDMSFEMMCEAWVEGPLRVVPPGNTTYTLEASNEFGSVTAVADVVVSAKPLAAYGFDTSVAHDGAGQTSAIPDGAGPPMFAKGAGQHGAGAFAFGGEGAMRISGNGEFAALGNREQGASISVAFWIRADASLASGAVALDAGIRLSKADNSHPDGLSVELPAGDHFIIDGVFDDAWHHIAVSVTTGTGAAPGRLHLFLDRQLEVEAAYIGGALGLPDDWSLGAATGGGSARLVGMVDELVVFGRAISGGEIAQLVGVGWSSFLLPRIVMFRADDLKVSPGSDVGLSWIVLDATSVELSTSHEIVDPIGEATVSIAGTATITLTASNERGSANRDVYIVTGPVPVIRQFEVSPDTLPAGGGSTTLSWEVSDSQSVWIDHGVGAVGETGERELAPTSLSTFRLMAENEFGSNSAIATASLIDQQVGRGWTLVIIPDTQNYAQSELNSPIFTEITNWIVDHRDSHDIRFVLHEGDIVDNNLATEWDRSRASLSVLDGIVPYAVTTGNHDLGPGGDASTRDGEFNLPTRFGAGSPYAAQATLGGYFGGTGDPSYRESTYHTFHAGGYDYLVLALEWLPRDEVVAWADDVVRSHPSHRAILLTHMYLNNASQRFGGVVGVGENNGVDLWEKLVSPNENFIMTANGHALSLGYLASAGDHGNTVHQMLFNAQNDANGGDGWIRLLEFQPDARSVEVKTFSPHREALGLSAWRTDAANQFTLQLSGAPRTDSDGDSIPDAWEFAYGLDPLDARDATMDPNGNGLSNFAEYATAGLPFARVERASPGLLEVDMSASDHRQFHYRRRLAGTSDLEYRIERSNDLKLWIPDTGDGSIFEEVAVINNGDSTETVTVEEVGPVSAARAPVYYRLRILGHD